MVKAFYGLVTSKITFYHTGCITGMLVVLITGFGANYVLMAMFVGHGPGMLMHFRQLMINMGLRYTLAYEYA